MKALLALILLSMITLPHFAQAEVQFLILGAESAESKDGFHLDINNPEKSEQLLWIRYFDQKQNSLEEVALSIAPGEVRKVDLRSFEGLTQGLSLVTRDSSSLKVQAWVERDERFLPLPLSSLSSDSLVVPLTDDRQIQKRILKFYNPTHLPTQITVKRRGEASAALSQIQLKAHESLSLDFESFVTSTQFTETELVIHSEVKIVASLQEWSEEGLRVRLAQASTPLEMSPPEEQKAYFLMANRNSEEGSSNFIVGISDPEMLKRARELVGQTEGPVFIGKLATGSGGFNRDFNHPSSAAWSWHVSEALEFSDFASQKCDGNPEMVEELLLGWMERIGTICFWNYRILKELSPEEISQGQLKSI